MSRKKYAPGGSIIRSIACQSFSWKSALAEWIDNAFDAAPNKDTSRSVVRIAIGAKQVQVSDNSLGHDRLHSMVQIGKHDAHSTTQIGEFGIGAKDAMLWIGSESSVVVIESTHKGIKRRLSVDWQDYADEWELDEPTEEPAKHGDVGTTITVTPRVRDVPHGKAWDRLLEEIGYLYARAIRGGAEIVISGPTKTAAPTKVTTWAPPEVEGEIIDTTINVDGKTARVWCGVVKQGVVNRRSGMTYFSSFRVIVPESHHGCGSFNTARVCGFVELNKGWKFSKNKDEILGNTEALYREVERVCLPVLKRADAAGSIMTSQAFARQVNDIVNDKLKKARAKAKRGEGTKTGRVMPKGSGKKHGDAANKQPGDSMPAEANTGVTVSYSHMGADVGAGRVKGNVIELNLDISDIAAGYDQKNALALAVIASSLVAAHHCLAKPIGPEGGRQLALRTPAKPEEFSIALGDLLTNVELDGQRAAEPRLKAV